MNVTAAMLVEGGRRARLCEAFNWNAGARGWMPLGRMTLGTPPGPSDRAFMDAGAGCKVQMEHRKMAFTLSGASVCGRRGRAIRKKIIGHGMFASRERFSRGNVLLPVLRRSRCSISQRASMAAEFSSIQRSRSAPISLRRSPRRESS